MRFTVSPAGPSEASPRSTQHTPPQYLARVHVHVAGETAGSAHEARLTLTSPSPPARTRAPLARVLRLDLLHPARALRCPPPRRYPGCDRPGDHREGDVPAPARSIVTRSDFASRQTHAGPRGTRPRPAFGTQTWPVFRDAPGGTVPAFPAPRSGDPWLPASGHCARPAGSAGWKNRVDRLGEGWRRLLLDRDEAGGQPRVPGPRLGELQALLPVARRALPPRPTVGVLLDGQVTATPGIAAITTRPLGREIEGQPVPGHCEHTIGYH